MNRLKKGMLVILTFVFIAIFIFSATQIIDYFNDVKENEKIIDEVLENIGEDIDQESFNFASLKAINSDVVGYLKVNGTDISNVVVRANDNEYYLSHNLKKDCNRAGWIFADYRNKLDGTDKNIIIYGHNMKSGLMFSSLKNILTKDWQETEGNMYVKFITERESLTYKVFSVYEIESEEYYITTAFTDTSFGDFVDKIKSRSQKDFNVEFASKSQILTLSTCDDSGKYRIVLHAMKI